MPSAELNSFHKQPASPIIFFFWIMLSYLITYMYLKKINNYYFLFKKYLNRWKEYCACCTATMPTISVFLYLTAVILLLSTGRLLTVVIILYCIVAYLLTYYYLVTTSLLFPVFPISRKCPCWRLRKSWNAMQYKVVVIDCRH